MKQITCTRIVGEEAPAGPEGSAAVLLRPDSRYLLVARMPAGMTPAMRVRLFEALGNVAKARKDSASTDFLVLPHGIDFDVFEYEPAVEGAE